MIAGFGMVYLFDKKPKRKKKKKAISTLNTECKD